MATINGTTGRNASHWKYFLICTEIKEDNYVSTNSTKLKVDVYLGATSYSRAVRGSIEAVHTINIDGTNYTFTTKAYTIEKNTNYLLGTITSNAITHNDDGSKKVSVTASSPDLAQASGYGPYTGTASGEVELTTIPRASLVTCADGNIGSSTTINIQRATDTFKHTLKYNFGNKSGTIATKISDTSYGWTIPTDFYSQIPNAKSGQGIIICETYNGDTLIGENECTFNATVLEETNKPTITATIVDSNAKTKALTGNENKLIKYFSNAKVTVNATAKNSATIASQKVTCGDGKSTEKTTDTLEGVESGTFTLTCTDSRGFPASNIVTKEIINYIKLAITSIEIGRESTTSDTVNVSLKGNYYNNSFGAASNSLTLKWRYRVKDGEWSTYTIITPTITNNIFSYTGILGTNFSYKTAYEFEIVAEDKLMTDPKIRPVDKGIPLVNMGEDDIIVNGEFSATTVNGYDLSTACEKEVDASTDLKPTSTSSNLPTTEAVAKMLLNCVYPVGSIYMSVNSTSPETFFGGTWVQLKDRFLLGAGDTYNNATTGGRKAVTLSANIGACNSDATTLGYITEGTTYYQNEIQQANYIVKGSSNPAFKEWNHSTPVTERNSIARDVEILPPYLTVFMWKRTA